MVEHYIADLLPEYKVSVRKKRGWTVVQTNDGDRADFLYLKGYVKDWGAVAENIRRMMGHV